MGIGGSRGTRLDLISPEIQSKNTTRRAEALRVFSCACGFCQGSLREGAGFCEAKDWGRVRQRRRIGWNVAREKGFVPQAPPPLCGSFSLRLGHARVLTPHRGVIHYAHAASLPLGGSLREMMLFLFADLLRKFICFLRVAEDVDPYGFDVYLSFIGSAIGCEICLFFYGSPRTSTPTGLMYIYRLSVRRLLCSMPFSSSVCSFVASTFPTGEGLR